MEPIARSTSLAESVAAKLRAAIVSGDYELGQALSERVLAEILRVSKTPVREALSLLRMEGLVKVLPQRGATVFLPNEDEVRELCELRQALESTAATRAMQRDHVGFADSLDDVVRRMTVAREKGRTRTYLECDTAFHQCFFDCCGNQLMASTYAIHSGKIAALRTHLAVRPMHTDLSFDEHGQIAIAARENDIERMLALIDTHIDRTKQSFARVIDAIQAAQLNAAQSSRSEITHGRQRISPQSKTV
ncbi:GntR family transcriptional regulator [Caballeronia sp. GAWG2-1]|uniref:GntR family transcriptional regulator n=1 Tax=Caballeronia sp. GAWG2-1 TaxID=2921744 RepID=UPI002027836E|nr:GntR family transcriptional regulator [Caballeronia sp. GAWG2-1]